ncbi:MULTISPECIES: agmatine deiminase family protein [Mycobacteriaceae]|nr:MULTISPECIES: agmatine deiminase family protein [Mycobacteriaceae]AHC23655.2 agmatine deiminase [Mycolicibacterium neoaurum VKM Ac-1815D]AMO04340.1 agmatine deiminase [Mycolicibacterium neoaurum]KJQ48920.1 agmatine deiminase [Mycolicibacterium neoaurum]KUM07475.1 agmatine deiminase [Mycolicibacterium neoaurum]
MSNRPTYMMPAEGATQDRVWMAFPSAGYSLGDTADEQHEARSTWAAVAHAIAEFEPVTMLVDPDEVDVAKRYLSQDIQTVEVPLDDAWMRDIGPTFVHTDDGSVAAVDWVFNGWGGQDWARWDRDCKVGAVVAELAGVPLVSSPLVNEGGGIHVDGCGTVLVTETVQLDPGRNPDLTKADVESELSRTIGATAVVWLPMGLTRDSQRFGTRGHVDIVATFAEPGRLLVHAQTDDNHPDAAVCHKIRHSLGERFEIVEIPAPTVLTDGEGFVDYSYINHLVVNGGVIACAFGDPRDREAAAILTEQYPGRRVVSVDARPLFARGGGIHCITQQQPSPR